MTSAFVWFHNSNKQPKESVLFYQKLLDWKKTDGPPGMTFFAAESGPFAAVAEQDGAVTGWVPYVQVEDVDGATKKATRLGGEVVQKRTRGPAGDFTVIRDPGGATLALWQKA
jgi:predicted enzyme related to lactoylglutathione lyase